MSHATIQDVPLIIENGLNVSAASVRPIVIIMGSCAAAADSKAIGATISAEETRIANMAVD
jgi:hypothetical protein